jgi:NAD+ kinase
VVTSLRTGQAQAVTSPPVAPAAAGLPPSPRLAVLASPAAAAQTALQELTRSRKWSPLEEADALVTVGGDGTLLHALHLLAAAGRQVPVFGLHRGTTGFLLNSWHSDEDLETRLVTALPERVVPLSLTATGPDGQVRPRVLAYNEVALRRTSSQSARLRLLVDGVVRLPQLVGDGLIVATPAGSTAYNRSAGGPVVPLSSGVLAVTSICALRPQRWPGALVSRASEIEVEVLDGEHRPVAVSADGRGEEVTSGVVVREVPERAATVLFDASDTLTERVLRFQFGT